jgi:K+-sensing histidine kinase KdpD
MRSQSQSGANCGRATYKKSKKLANRLSIFPTATLSFVILISDKLAMHLTDLINKTGVKTATGWVRALPLMDAAIGGLVCGLAAVGFSAAAEGHTWKNMVPLLFTAVLLLIAALLGARAGILGTLLAAMIFANFLFGPIGSIQVANESARANLGWMLLIGIGFSFLFAPPTSRCRRH